MEKKEPLYTIGRSSATVENRMEFTQKLKMELLFDPEIPVLGIYHKNHETLIQKNICTPMFISTLLIISSFWKQLKFPSVDKWIKRGDTFTQWNITWP